MDLLIIGGGVFLGRACLTAALHAGHRVTVFNRGKARTDWPGGVEVVLGDRKSELHHLAGRRWDAVIDTCGYLPHDVLASAQALGKACGRYLFVSSVSVYASFRQAPVRESDALAQLGAKPQDTVTNENYGALKAACEAAVTATLGAARDARPARSHRRRRRPHRAFLVLALALRARRRRTRTGPARASRAVHRCHRPRNLDGGLGRSGSCRDVQRHRAGGRLHVGRVADGVRDRGGAARRPDVRDHLGRRRLADRSSRSRRGANYRCGCRRRTRRWRPSTPWTSVAPSRQGCGHGRSRRRSKRSLREAYRRRAIRDGSESSRASAKSR